MVKQGAARGVGFGNGIAPKSAIELTVSLSDVDILLFPDPTPQPITGDDPLLGEHKSTMVVVHISLAIPASVTPPDSIAALTVDLKSDETLGFPSGIYERNNPYQLQVKVDSATGMKLESGQEYHWEVPLKISASSAPYERGIYGRLFHKVTATIDWPGWGGWWKAGKSLVAEQVVFLVSVPPSTDVISYAHTHNGFSELLGPVILHTRSRQLSVGGYLRAALSLPSTAPGTQLLKLTLTLVQGTMLVSRREPGHVEHCQPERIALTNLGPAELQAKTKRVTGEDQCDSLDVDWIARIANDLQARSSTLLGNKAAIRRDHVLEMSLTYQGTGQDEPATYLASWPVLLPACSVTWRHMKLPSYSKNDPNPVPDRSRDAWEPEKYANIHVSHTTCACGQSLEKLLSWEDEGDDEDQTSTSSMMREAVRSASSSIELDRTREQSRSRSRGRSGLSRESSARPSLDSSRESQGYDSDGERGEREARRRFHLKAAQQYTP